MRRRNSHQHGHAPHGINFTLTAQNASDVSGSGQIVEGTGSFTFTIKLPGWPPAGAT
ncbi:MAG: hypothetical protein ACYDB4_12700 [Candidatus Dormibacteraceae bacterium]